MRNSRLLLVIAGCSSAPALPPTRFVNAPAVTVVDDRRDVPKPPEPYVNLQNVEFWDASVERPLTRALEVPRSRRALGVNALDEVPDSTWFTNRIGARDLSPAEVRNGPLTVDSPELHRPWTVHSTKLGGSAADGIVITDARGIKYMLKFELRGHPLATGAHVVVNRILWACGYHVPEDSVVYLQASDLVIAPDAKKKDRIGATTGRLTADDLARSLAAVPREPDGRIRALASRWLDGKAIGGYPDEGLRAGDPNDRIPHELRRDLRGERPIVAWVDHTEMNRSNFLDMWVADGADHHRHYVEHYQMDFGSAMGVKGLVRHDLRDGRAHELDFGDLFAAFITFGLDDRPWGHHFAPELRGVSPLFVAASFDPGGWQTDEEYAPFVAGDRIDGFWGAKLMARFTRADLRAAVEAGRFTDPRTVEYLVDTLVRRQRATLAYWFARVNPLDRFAIALDGQLCFDDLAISSGLAAASSTRYTAASFSHSGHAIAPAVTHGASGTGRRCMAVAADLSASGYTIVRVTTQRPDFHGSTFVHLSHDRASGALRVIGIWRE